MEHARVNPEATRCYEPWVMEGSPQMRRSLGKGGMRVREGGMHRLNDGEALGCYDNGCGAETVEEQGGERNVRRECHHPVARTL